MNHIRKISFTLVCSFLFHISLAQYIIKGKVTDESGIPIQAVSVTINKDNAATVTDADGNFRLQSSDAETLVHMAYAGREPETRKIKSGENPTIALRSVVLDDGLVVRGIVLDDVKVNAFERNSGIMNASVAVSILNKSALERYGNTNFLPAMNTVPGVKMDERSPGSYRLSIRGNLLRSTFGVRNVKFYWNGIPFTDANGNTYLNQVSFLNAGRFEVIKGPSGSMYGSGTGGVVLMSSPVNTDNGNSFQLQSAVGSYGLFALHGSYNVSNNHNNSSLSYSHQQSDGYRDHTNMRKDVANYTGSFKISSKQDVSVNIFYSDLYYQTPGGLTAAELAANPRQSRPAAGIFRSAVELKAALYLKTLYAGFANNYHFNEKWSNTTSIYASHTSLRNPTIRNDEHKTEQGIGMRSVLRYEHKAFTGTLGGEYQYSFNNVSVFGNRMGVTDTLQFHDEITSRQFNTFLQAALKLGRTFISGGISYNNYHYGFFRLSDVGSPKNSSDFAPQLIPRLSVMHELNSRFNIYASVSKGYSPPSIDEVHASDGVFNTSLRAETGINYEAGLKTNPIKNKLWADVTYYYFSLQNTIVSRRDASGGDFYVNAGKTKQRGLEVAVNYIPVNNDVHFLRMLKVWGSYTNIDAKFSEYQQGNVKFDGNKLTGTPPNVVVIGTDINTAVGISGNFSYNYTDAIPLNDANTFVATHYNLVYGKLGFKTSLSGSVAAELYIAAEHSFNEPFSLGNDLNAAGNRFYNPSAPDNFTAGVKLKFHSKKR